MKTKLTNKGHPVRDLTEDEIDQMKERIKELGISRREYLRALVHREMFTHPLQADDLAS